MSFYAQTAQATCHALRAVARGRFRHPDKGHSSSLTTAQFRDIKYRAASPSYSSSRQHISQPRTNVPAKHGRPSPNQDVYKMPATRSATRREQTAHRFNILFSAMEESGNKKVAHWLEGPKDHLCAPKSQGVTSPEQGPYNLRPRSSRTSSGTPHAWPTLSGTGRLLSDGPRLRHSVSCTEVRISHRSTSVVVEVETISDAFTERGEQATVGEEDYGTPLDQPDDYDMAEDDEDRMSISTIHSAGRAMSIEPEAHISGEVLSRPASTARNWEYAGSPWLPRYGSRVDASMRSISDLSDASSEATLMDSGGFCTAKVASLSLKRDVTMKDLVQTDTPAAKAFKSEMSIDEQSSLWRQQLRSDAQTAKPHKAAMSIDEGSPRWKKPLKPEMSIDLDFSLYQ